MDNGFRNIRRNLSGSRSDRVEFSVNKARLLQFQVIVTDSGGRQTRVTWAPRPTGVTLANVQQGTRAHAAAGPTIRPSPS